MVRAVRCISPPAARRRLSQLAARGITHVQDVANVRWLANRFKTSLRATTIRLIELEVATWNLYDELPVIADNKHGGGGGGGGRVLREIREDQVGRRTADLFHRAVDADVMDRARALAYLDVPDPDFDALAPRR